jgi:Uncharacterised protein family (UPF0182)
VLHLQCHIGRDTLCLVRRGAEVTGLDFSGAALEFARFRTAVDIGQRILFAWYFRDVNPLLSSYVAADSRIMMRRDVQERVRTIAPFLRLDHDPYLVVSDGRLFWMQDAYTTSAYFPYAQPVRDLDLNYIRNSVKVVVDAYNGTVDFYLMDSADSVAATYQRIFPGLFKPFANMPQGLQQHIRYPEDMFLIQARLYQTYHMTAADVFYNREDRVRSKVMHSRCGFFVTRLVSITGASLRFPSEFATVMVIDAKRNANFRGRLKNCQ